MAIEDLIVFQKAYDFLVWQKAIVKHLSKVHKYSIGIQLENETLDLLKQIVRTNISRENKREGIIECLAALEVIKVLIRVGHEFNKEGGISAAHYETASEKIVELGKLLGAWLKKF